LQRKDFDKQAKCYQENHHFVFYIIENKEATCHCGKRINIMKDRFNNCSANYAMSQLNLQLQIQLALLCKNAKSFKHKNCAIQAVYESP
jgi:hypothetical protein